MSTFFQKTAVIGLTNGSEHKPAKRGAFQDITNKVANQPKAILISIFKKRASQKGVETKQPFYQGGARGKRPNPTTSQNESVNFQDDDLSGLFANERSLQDYESSLGSSSSDDDSGEEEEDEEDDIEDNTSVSSVASVASASSQVRLIINDNNNALIIISFLIFLFLF